LRASRRFPNFDLQEFTFKDGDNEIRGRRKVAKIHNLPYSLVLNVCTRTFEQNKAWLEKIASQGHKVPRIEIGNEVYFNVIRTWERCTRT
jgi:hypothetical protein